MQGTKEIKRRIKSVKSTKKITKAMELVAASKMKRAVSATLASRLYAEYSWEILTSIGKNVEEITHPLFTDPVRSPSRRGTAGVSERQTSNGVNRPTPSILLILITSNRGLCGAYNAQVIKKVLALFKNLPAGRQDGNDKINIDTVTVGKKGDVAMRRIGKKVIATFGELPANITLRDALPISKLAINEYAAGKYDKVLVAYTDFKSAMSQVPNLRQVVPVSKADLRDTIDNLHLTVDQVALSSGQRSNVPPSPSLRRAGAGQMLNVNGHMSNVSYLIEGDKNALLGSLAEKLVRMQIYQMLLESNASEQSSRMVAMKNASDAAGEMIDDLTLAFNKARQAGITQEISEISAGMASVS